MQLIPLPKEWETLCRPGLEGRGRLKRKKCDRTTDSEKSCRRLEA
jgi:hypothetical protein